jgi:hypothetical protein
MPKSRGGMPSDRLLPTSLTVEGVVKAPLVLSDITFVFENYIWFTNVAFKFIID